MKLIRCRKCGTFVISEEMFLQPMIDTLEEATRSAHLAKNREDRYAYLADVANYRAFIRVFMHHLTERDKAAHNVDAYKVAALYDALVRTGKITEEEFKAAVAEGNSRAAKKREAEDRELRVIYGDYDSYKKARLPNPTERDALRHYKKAWEGKQ